MELLFSWLLFKEYLCNNYIYENKTIIIKHFLSFFFKLGKTNFSENYDSIFTICKLIFISTYFRRLLDWAIDLFSLICTIFLFFFHSISFSFLDFLYKIFCNHMHIQHSIRCSGKRAVLLPGCVCWYVYTKCQKCRCRDTPIQWAPLVAWYSPDFTLIWARQHIYDSAVTLLYIYSVWVWPFGMWRIRSAGVLGFVRRKSVGRFKALALSELYELWAEVTLTEKAPSGNVCAGVLLYERGEGGCLCINVSLCGVSQC